MRKTRKLLTGVLVAVASTLAWPTVAQVADLEAQAVLTDPEQTVTVSKGMSAIIEFPGAFERVSIADPTVADAVPLSASEILINAINVGSTSLVVWGQDNRPRLYAIEVYADIAGLERQLAALFPGTGLTLSTQGSTLILSGVARDPSVVRRAIEIASASGVTVINNVAAPFPQQIMLHVQFAEVNRTALKAVAADLIALNPQIADNAFRNLQNFGIQESTTEGLRGDITGSVAGVETLSEGLINFLVFGEGTQLGAMIRALKSNGNFKSLAEPNLMALEGEEATFLAGGEFPYPVIQPGGEGNSVTITFKEFGVRLAFTPEVTNTGSIRLRVAPEVSSLDFANGLTLGGFQIPSLLTRRVETQVDLMAGQHLAIGGLLDNSILEQVDKLPILGDIPILGTFFKSESVRQNHSELLVVVTPYMVDPSGNPIPLPTGQPQSWSDWDGFVPNPSGLHGTQPADSAGAAMPQGSRDPGSN